MVCVGAVIVKLRQQYAAFHVPGIRIPAAHQEIAVMTEALVVNALHVEYCVLNSGQLLLVRYLEQLVVVTPRYIAIRGSSAMSGILASVSRLDTACVVTPTNSASSS